MDSQLFKVTSLYLKDPLSSQTLKVIDKYYSQPNINANYTIIDSYGGQINMLSLDFNAFAHRDVIASIQILAYWQNEAKKHMQLKWSKQYYLALKKFGKGAYRNYPDLWLNDWGREYYGNNWGRLKQNNLFNYEQSILAK